MTRSAAALIALMVIGGLVGTTSCTKPDAPAAPARQIREVTLPDLSRMDAPVQNQVRARYAAVGELKKKGASDAELSDAYGQYGIVLQAAEYYEAAETAYLNAQELAPTDLRWPYYLGHVYKSQGQTDKAIQAFNRSLELGPNEIATLIWLGRLYLETGQPDKAEPMTRNARCAIAAFCARICARSCAVSRRIPSGV